MSDDLNVERANVESNQSNSENFCHQCKVHFKDFYTRLSHNCKPFKCRTCFVEFLYDYQLEMHQCTYEKNVNENGAGNEKESYICHFCDSTFLTSAVLLQHENCCFKKKRSSESSNKNAKRKINGTFSLNQRRQKKNPDQVLDSEHELKLENSKTSINGTFLNNLTDLPAKEKIHVSGKFRGSRKSRAEPAAEVNASSNTNINNVPKAKKSVLKLKKKNSSKKTCSRSQHMVSEDEIIDVVTLSNDTTIGEINNELVHELKNVEETELNCSKNKLKIVKDGLHDEVAASNDDDSTDINLVLNQTDNYGKKLKDTNTDNIFEKIAKELQHSVIVSSNSAKLNGISDNLLPKLTTESVQKSSHKNTLVKNMNRRKTGKNHRTVSLNSEPKSSKRIMKKKEVSVLNDASAKDCSSDQRKTRQKRNSKHRDSSVSSLESESSTLSSASLKSHINNSEKNKRKIVRFPADARKEINKSSNDQQKIRKRPSKKLLISDNTYGNSCSSFNHFNTSGSKNMNQPRKLLSDTNNALGQPTNISRELELSESTLNDIPDDTYYGKVYYPNTNELGHHIKGKKSTTDDFSDKNITELGSLLNILPMESGILLKTSTGSFLNFRCPRCNKPFKYLKTGSNHLTSCRSSKFRKNTRISLNEVIYVCITCSYNSNRMSDLNNHKRCCTPNYFPDFLLNYEDTNKKYICSKCSYSCLSCHKFSNHPCKERLEQMTTCIVNVKKLEPDTITCGKCKHFFQDELAFQKHTKTCFPEGEKVSKICLYGGRQGMREKIKKFMQSTENCQTTEDMLKNVVDPISKINATLDLEDQLPDLLLDLTMPLGNQELLSEAAKNYLAKQGDSIDSTQNTNADSSTGSDTALKSFKCTCDNKKNVDSSVEGKPCIKCLNQFIRDRFLTDNRSIKRDNEPAGGNGSADDDKFAFVNVANQRSSNNTTGLPVNPSCVLPPPEPCSSEAASSEATSSEAALNAFRLLFERFQTPSAPILSDKSVFSDTVGTSSNSDDHLMNNLNPDNTSHVNLDAVNLIDLENSNARDEQNNAPETISEGNMNSEKHPSHCTSRASVQSEESSDILLSYTDSKLTISTNEFKMTVSTDRRDVNLNEGDFLRVVMNLGDNLRETASSYEHGLDTLIFEEIINVIAEYEFNVDFQLNSFHLFIHYSLQNEAVYSAYIIKKNSRYICGTCTYVCSPSNLIQHIIQVHEEKDIGIYIT